MQLLSSKNWDYVSVKIRDYDEPIKLPVSVGAKLMDYLTSPNAANHVQITLDDGTPIVVKTHDILRVEPLKKLKELKDYA